MAEALSYLRPVYVEEWRVSEYVAGSRVAAMGMAAVAAVGLLVVSVLAVWGRLSWWVAVSCAPGGIGLCVPLLVAGAKVTTTVEPDRLVLTLHAAGVRVWRRRVPLRQVVACDVGRAGEAVADGWVVPNRTALVQRRGDATLVMVTGHPVVVLRGGRFGGRLVVGTREPEVLAAAIRAGMATPGPVDG